MIEPITVAITQAVFIKGLKKDVSSKDIKAIAQYVRQYITLHKPLYRIGEIVQAIELGSLGELSELNDLNGLSPELIVKWIHRFHEKFRKEAIHKQHVHEEKLKELKTEQKRIDGEKMIDSAIEELYELYLKGFDVYEVVREKTPAPTSLLACWYRHLDSRGLVKISKDDKIIIFGIAEEKIEKAIPSKEEAKEFQIYNQTKKTQIKELAQSMALIEVFLLFKEQGKPQVFN